MVLDDALDVLVELLPRLWVPAGLSRSARLPTEAAWLAAGVGMGSGQAAHSSRRLVDATLDIFASTPVLAG